MIILIATPLKRKEEGCWSVLGTKCISVFPLKIVKDHWYIRGSQRSYSQGTLLNFCLSHCFPGSGTDRPRRGQNSEILPGSGFERLWLYLECSFSLNKLGFHEQVDRTPLGFLLPEFSVGNRLALRIYLSPSPKNLPPTIHISICPFTTSIYPSLTHPLC